MSRTVVVLAGCAFASLLAGGCGARLVPVAGVVKLDGSPVEGATVVFTSEDGTKSYSGFTDAGGNFSLVAGAQAGALPGTYKVTVVKTEKVAGAESMAPGGADYTKQMQKEQKSDASPGPGVGPKMPGGAMPKMPGGVMPPGGMTGPGLPGQAKGPKSSLPAIYGSTTTTPLSVKVPPENQPVAIDLKAKQ